METHRIRSEKHGGIGRYGSVFPESPQREFQTGFGATRFLLLLALIGMVFPDGLSAREVGQGAKKMKYETIFNGGEGTTAHTVSLVETKVGTLLAAWIGVTAPGEPIAVHLAYRENGSWGAPVKIVAADEKDGLGTRVWNPVLVQPRKGPLLLFFKVGTKPADWWGEMLLSHDEGRTWSERRKLPNRGVGPVRNKALELPDGRLLCPCSTEAGDDWRVFMEETSDLGNTWVVSKPLHTREEAQAIQPTLFRHEGDVLQMLCRNRDGNSTLWEAWSRDAGKSWGPLRPTVLPCPNSAVDGLTLADGRLLLVYNHTNTDPLKPGWPVDREMLNLAISKDGKLWEAAGVLDLIRGGAVAYPAVIQARDGLVHIAYTQGQKESLRHLVIDPETLRGMPMDDGVWPLDITP